MKRKNEVLASVFKGEIMFKTFILVNLLLLPNAYAVNCDKHPIFCQIKKNSPRFNNKKAMHISNVISKVSRKHKLPTRIFVGILAQESGYKLSAQGCHKGLMASDRKQSSCDIPLIQGTMLDFEYKTCLDSLKPKVVRICSDFGIGQIYYKTAKGFGFDIELLTTDLEYSIDAAAQVLADFKKRYSAREVDWWTRYNARSPIKRKIYKTLVKRYF